MKMTFGGWIVALAAFGWTMPSTAQHGAAALPDQRRSPPTTVAESDVGRAEVTALARMLRAQTDLSWLLSPPDAARITPSPEQEAEARSIIDLAGVARYRGLDQGSEMRIAARVLETAVLAEAARRDLLKSIVVTDKDIAAMLLARPGRYDEYRLSHIFVAVGETAHAGARTDAEAKAKAMQLRKRIESGEDFAAIAKRESDDASTAEEGGSLPSMFGRYMANEFFPHVRALPTDTVSDPVRGTSGYHLLRIEDRIPATVASARFLVTEDIRAMKMPLLIADAVRASRR